MGENSKIVDTPLMRQYFKVKAEHPDALLLFRVGDFYETFGEDAVTTSRVLGIVLTRRANGAAQFVELAGFPHHALDNYLPKLVRSGLKVAVCDQLEDPKLAKKIVKRGITELVTPGIAYSDELLDQKENNYLCAASFDGKKGGVAFLDISTGTFRVAEGDLDYIDMLLSSMSPKEIVIQRGYRDGFRERFGDKYYLSYMDEWAFANRACEDKLKEQFSLGSLKGFGVEGMDLAITAAGAILFYLEQNHNKSVSQLCSIQRIERDRYVWLDRFTVRNLELFASAAPDGVSLLQVIDRTCCPLGARLLRNWLSLPIKELDEIKERHDAVEAFYNDSSALDELRELLGNVGDLERIISRAAAGKIMPRELNQLKRGLKQLEPIKQLLSSIAESAKVPVMGKLRDSIMLFSELRDFIEKHLLADPAPLFGKGDIIADGVDNELDELRQIARHGKDYLQQLQEREIERTGIPSLKISYNNVFGYYLEVRNTHKEKVPPEWIRKQTLVSAERYITQELKEYEEKILGAEERIASIEQRVYQQIVAEVQNNIPAIQTVSKVIAKVDVLSSFAASAISNHYCKPQMDDSLVIDITDGRHPVIETLMKPGEEYVPNSLHLDSNDNQIMILTGPNMAGKSALLRQTALIVLMAQIGSFVPAKAATLGITDKIFTRVGASDNISRGESTFMVEMTETATILHNISNRSLVLLDEIGRGTSTFDGMSIAWAIVEYLHECGVRPKTLFATHYHELNELEEIYSRVKNWHILVKEVGNKVLFLRKLAPGGVAHSFGIHVARMAGMPKSVIESAERTLRQLESGEGGECGGQNGCENGGGGNGKADICREEKKEKKRGGKAGDDGLQLSFYQLDDPMLLDLKNDLVKLDINNMTPLDAFDAIRRLKSKLNIS